jgi:CubicO group peptidase (beta-lactamase class C family)
MKSELEQKIERIVSRLLPECSLSNRFGEEATLVDRLTHYKTPGISIAVVNDFEIEWARGFGVKEWGKAAPVTEQTIFQAGSISKPLFAIGVMRLVQEGRINLDDDINRYLRSWKIPANEGWQPKVTLRQLLSHTAGLTVHGFPGYADSEPIPTVEQILDGRAPADTSAVRVNLIPGTAFRYSGGGTVVAQQAICDVMAANFPDLMRSLVLEPLGMDNSTYEQSLPEELRHAAAVAHPWKYRKIPGNWHRYPEMAAAGLWTTPTDLAWAGLELQHALKSANGKVLDKSTVEQMLTPQVEDFIGLGFFLQGKGETSRFGHEGWDEGFVARMTMYTHLGKGAVIMANSNQGNAMIAEIERAIAKEYEWPDYFPQEKIAIEIGREIAGDYAGKYRTKEGDMRIVVSVQDGRLYVQVNEQLPIELHAESEMNFFMKAVNAEVIFEKRDGEMAGLALVLGGKQYIAEKQAPDPESSY